MTDAKILVPLDGSPFAENAIPVAVSLARLLGARLEFVSVYLEEPIIAEWQIPGEELRASYVEYLERVITRLQEVVDVNASPTVLSGPVADVLEHHIRDTNPVLVVMSTHGRGPLSRAWLGSVADRLVRHVTVPVLLLRPQEEGPIDLRSVFVFRRILVALDGSPRAEAGLDWARRFGQALDAHCVLVRAVPSRFNASPYLPHTVQETQEAMDQAAKEAKTYIERVTQELRDRGLSAEGCVLTGVLPGSGITRHANRTGADLIVITTHGRSGLPRLVLGSVADKVIRSATIPVLIIRGTAADRSHHEHS